MATVFFSYSHRDENLRDELEVHLAGLKRQGAITTWHDRRIDAGHDFAKAIDERLEDAEIILLLVSPYFIASDYCFDIEMKRALERHEKGEARVIPVILEPSDWQSTPFGHLNAVPKDGKPITKYPNHHDAFLEITQAVRTAAAEFPAGKSEPPNNLMSSHTLPRNVIRSSNLGIKKQYSDRDRDNYLHNAFEYMANFFEGSLEELESRYDEIDTRFQRIDAKTFEAVVYRNGKSVSRCKIFLTDNSLYPSSGGGIAYSSDPRSSGYNDMLQTVAGDRNLSLKASNAYSFNNSSNDLSQQGAAEYFWSRIIQPLQ